MKATMNYSQMCKLQSITVLFIGFFLFVASATSAPLKLAKNKTFILTQQQWSVPRDAMSVLSMPAVQSAMQSLVSEQKQSLIVRYPGGEVGMLWASELKGWLVSLGLSSDLINVQAGSLKSEELELQVIKGNVNNF